MRYSVFLDSGAYSALTQGVDINLDDYIAFIKKYKDVIDVYAALDVIGDPKASYKNTKYMIKKGLNPVPTYHLCSRKFHWFERLVNEFQFVGIGGMVSFLIGKKERHYLLSRCFNYLSNHGLLKSVKIHGFACTSIPLMIDFPWHSVDSSTWIQVSRHGGILVPRRLFGGKGIDADKPVIAVSNRRTNISNYYKRLPRRYREKLIEYLKRIGKQYFDDEMRFRFKNIGVIKGSYKYRDEICAIYFRELEEELAGISSEFFVKEKLV